MKEIDFIQALKTSISGGRSSKKASSTGFWALWGLGIAAVVGCAREPKQSAVVEEFGVRATAELGAYPMGADSAYRVRISFENKGKASVFECITNLKVGDAIHRDTTVHSIDSAGSAGSEIVFADVPYHARIQAEVQLELHPQALSKTGER